MFHDDGHRLQRSRWPFRGIAEPGDSLGSAARAL
jgi:hypothetical protein